MIEIKLTSEEKVLVHVNPVTSTGKPAELDGDVVFSVTSGDATLEAQPDGRSAFLISGNSASESKIMISADADLGEGVKTISEEISLMVSNPLAATLGLQVDPVQPK